MKGKWQSGDKVQSVFRANWHGIVLGLAPNYDHPVYDVLPILTQDGRVQRKPRVRTLDGAWLKTSDKTMTLPTNINALVRKPA